MSKLKFKSYLITNIPERDWKRFKRWAAIEEFSNLNDAIYSLIKTASSTDFRNSTDTKVGDAVAKTT